MNLCVIPARGGSKRIPQKNIRNFFGKPMIVYAIEAAQSSNLFSQIVVSTDDRKISEIARQHGAEVPFKRPAELSDDFTPTVDVIRHAINETQRLGMYFENVCCVYPAVPFIEAADLDLALALIDHESASYSFPVSEFSSAIYRALRLGDQNRLEPIYLDYELQRSQDLVRTYHDAGQFYWAHKNTWMSIDKIHSNGRGLVIPRWRNVDIDTLEDLRMAELMYAALKDKNER